MENEFGTTYNSYILKTKDKVVLFETVKDNDTLDLGDKTLRFMSAPNLHWPDTMYTYIEEDNTLVTCDSFGSHYCCEDILLSKVTDNEGYMRATKYYFDNIIGPFKPYRLKALDKIKDLELDMICTGHGPVIDCRIDEIKETYKNWCTVINPNPRKTVIIPYVSAYGYTKELANEIAKGIKDSGDCAEFNNTNYGIWPQAVEENRPFKKIF